MALGNREIQVVKSYISTLSSIKNDLVSCVDTIRYVKENNDLVNWFDDTAIGSKWSQNVDKLIKASDSLNGQALPKLIESTNQLLEKQEQINKQG